MNSGEHLKTAALYGALVSLGLRLALFLAQIDGVAVPDEIHAVVIGFSSIGGAVALTLGNVCLAHFTPRTPSIAVGWVFLLVCIGLILWPDVRIGIKGVEGVGSGHGEVEAVLSEIASWLPDAYSFILVMSPELMVILVFYNGDGGRKPAEDLEDPEALTAAHLKIAALEKQLAESGGPSKAVEEPPRELPPEPPPDPRTKRERVLDALAELGKADTPAIAVCSGLTETQVKNGLKNAPVHRHPGEGARGRTLYELVEVSDR